MQCPECESSIFFHDDASWDTALDEICPALLPDDARVRIREKGPFEGRSGTFVGSVFARTRDGEEFRWFEIVPDGEDNPVGFDAGAFERLPA